MGVKIEGDPTTGLMELKQTCLIERVIETLGSDVGTTTGKCIPAKRTILGKNDSGEPMTSEFCCSSVIKMLLCLPRHSRPDIACALNCCACYMFQPKKSHDLAFKWIGRLPRTVWTDSQSIQAPQH